MPLDHERLEVYQIALDLFDLVDEIAEQLPRGRGHLSDQLSRAGLSIVNNIAEGAGKFSAGDKRRYYLAANGSTMECAAMLDVCARRRLIAEDDRRRGKQLAERIVGMLTKLALSHEPLSR
jgi:four helix bundle protein